MAHDHLEDEGQSTRRGGARFVAAGVVGACVLGVGLGLWARPSSAERGDAPAPPKPEVEAALSDRRLQIVLDDSPAPIGQPLEVMPADTPGLMLDAPYPSSAEPQLPGTQPTGLMKVDAPVAAPLAVAPAVIPVVRPEPKAEPKAEPRPEPKPAPKAEKPKVEKSKAKPVVAKPVVAKAEKKAEKKKPETKVAKAKKKDAPAKRLAKAGTSKKKADARKERPVKLAKAETPAKKKAGSEAKAEKPAKLTKLVKAVKSAPKTLKAKANATAERKKKRDVELAEAKRAKAKKAKPAVERASTPKKKPAPRGEGPMRVARNDGCVSADPGEALVCADPRLNQRDRQLQRALRDAEAAGVPASALRRQQERLRQARAAAARDGSWAVEDVYEARIAELNDLARDARDY